MCLGLDLGKFGVEGFLVSIGQGLMVKPESRYGVENSKTGWYQQKSDELSEEFGSVLNYLSNLFQLQLSALVIIETSCETYGKYCSIKMR